MQTIYLKQPNIIQPIFKTYGFNLFKRKPIVLSDKYLRWRKVAKLINLSQNGLMRLEWIVFYYAVSGCNATKTAKHFNISRRCIHKWLRLFKQSKANIKVLETKSSKPHNVRKWEVTLLEETRIKQLRNQYPYWGKKKLKVIYQRAYNQPISTWKIERVIRHHNLYPSKIKHDKLVKKKKRNQTKPVKRIQDLVKQPISWFLIQLDGITIYYQGLKRYIFTAVDYNGKFAFARMYTNKSSVSTKDFLFRLKYAINQPIINVQTDNGSEFKGAFDKALNQLEINHWFSRVKTPQDNGGVERFNETLEYEWLCDSNLTLDCKKFNKALTKWLIIYNSIRPHQSLAYLTPIEYIQINTNVLPMWSARTKP
jgi:transposase